LLIAVIGSLGQGSINLYSMGLDLDAILPKLTRIQSTALVAALGTALVFIGKFVYDAEAAVTNSVLFLTCLATSWVSIALLGYWKHKGVIDKEALQAFNRRTTGGSYWYKGGWNPAAVFAWVIGSVVGILGISSVDYVGPLSNVFDGLDVSIPAAAISALLSYSILNRTKR
jgi:purine-cytosine permease-like protein